jgi:NAD-dependent DNA ligase
VTGEFDKVSRDKIQEIIINHGGSFVTGVSKLINILLVGRILSTGFPPETSKKYLEATKLGK